MSAPVERIAQKLRDLDRRVTGSAAKGYMAQCPAHEDREPSLSIDEGDVGQALVHCFGGCEVERVLAALDLSYQELFPEDTWPEYLKSATRGSTHDRRAQSDRDSERVALPPSRPCSRSRSRSTEFPENTGDTEQADEYIVRRVRDAEAGRERVDFDVPLRVQGRLAPQASMLRALVSRVEVVMGLALTDGDTDSTPLTVGLVALLMGKEPRNKHHRRQAWNAREVLVARQIIRWDRRLPTKHEKWVGADCYQPFDFELATLFGGVDPGEVGEIGERLVGLEPDAEVGEEPAVHGTKFDVASAGAVGVIAGDDGAGTTTGHVQDGTAASGGLGAQTKLDLERRSERADERERRAQELLRQVRERTR